ncbi:MAG: PAS domain S-box protein [Methylophilaceae bacterium]
MTKKNRTGRVPLPYIKEAELHCSAESLNTPEDKRPPPDHPCPACGMGSTEQIEHAKQEWESTADSMPQLICLLDETGHILRANRTVERWGLGKVAAVRGRKMHELLHPDCHDANCFQRSFWESAFDTMGEDGSAECQIDDRFLRRHLHLCFQLHQANQDGNAKMRSHFSVAVVDDISDLKHAEKKLQLLNHELELRGEARTSELVCANLRLKQEIEDRKRIGAELKKSREEFRLLVETMSEGLMVCNKKGLITYINDRLCEMLERTREEIIGCPASDYIDASSRAVWAQQIAKVKAGIATSDELKLKALKSPEIWAKVSPSPLLDEHGKIAGSFAVVTDISERIHTEQALRESKSQLRLLSEQVMLAQEKERQRVAGELHDGIGQTLSAVKFCVETGIKRLYDKPSEEVIGQLESVIPRIQDAIEEVRRISMALRPSILDDIGILATLTWFCRESALVYEDIYVHLQLDIKEECIPVQTKVAIFRIVQEAFNNAVKHSRAEFMHITLKHTDETIELNIEDNGIGFNAKRTGPNNYRASGGLGLISMRERAEFSGGLYAIDSAKGKGARIRVIWSLQAAKNL